MIRQGNDKVLIELAFDVMMIAFTIKAIFIPIICRNVRAARGIGFLFMKAPLKLKEL